MQQLKIAVTKQRPSSFSRNDSKLLAQFICNHSVAQCTVRSEDIKSIAFFMC